MEPSRAWIEQVRAQNRQRLGLAGLGDSVPEYDRLKGQATKFGIGTAVAVFFAAWWLWRNR